jgi:sulfur-carrier protein
MHHRGPQASPAGRGFCPEWLRQARRPGTVRPVRCQSRQVVGMIRVILPFHLRNLAHVGSEVALEVEGPITQRSVLDALEARYPMLRGTIRDHGTLERRPFLRFFACEEDLSHEPPDAPLPEAVASGKEPFIVIGAIAGG